MTRSDSVFPSKTIAQFGTHEWFRKEGPINSPSPVGFKSWSSIENTLLVS